MLRVLTLSTLYPSAARPTLGVFVERQTQGLAALPKTQVQVVSAAGLPPWPLSLHPHYAPLHALPLKETWNGVTVHRPRFTTLLGTLARHNARSMARSLLPYLRELRRVFPFDVIDAEFFWPDGPAAMLLARALGIPFSIKARGADVQWWPHRSGIGTQIRQAAQAANGLLAVSESLQADMAALGMPEHKIRVHRTGVDTALFHPGLRQGAKEQLGLSGPVIVTAGALIPRKGQSFAIQALAHLPDATLVLVGDGPDRAALQAQAARLGLTARVRFEGVQPHARLPLYLAAADVMLLPTASEGLANVWVESLACGTPVVTCDVGGAREVITASDAGRLVPREPEALAAAIQDIIRRDPQPDTVAAFAANYRWDRNAADLRAHLASCRSCPTP